MLFKGGIAMILDVILGVNADTPMWIRELKLNLSDYICVIDYDYYGEPAMFNEVMYISNIDAKEYFGKFDSICFYKSMYIYPGIHNLKFSGKPSGNSE